MVRNKVRNEDTNTSAREIGALARLHTFEPLKEAIIVTRDDERVITADNGLRIKVTPVWKWLMDAHGQRPGQ